MTSNPDRAEACWQYLAVNARVLAPFHVAQLLITRRGSTFFPPPHASKLAKLTWSMIQNADFIFGCPKQRRTVIINGSVSRMVLGTGELSA